MERGVFRRGINVIVEGSHRHARALTAGGGLGAAVAIEASPLPSPAREFIAIPTGIVGAALGFHAMAIEWFKRNINEVEHLK